MAKFWLRMLLVVTGIVCYCMIPFTSLIMNITNWIIFLFVIFAVYVIEKEEKINGGRK